MPRQSYTLPVKNFPHQMRKAMVNSDMDIHPVHCAMQSRINAQRLILFLRKEGFKLHTEGHVP